MAAPLSIVWSEQFEGPHPPEYTPEYTESAAPPGYSQHLHRNEERLSVNPYEQRFRFLTSVFTKSSKRKDIVLTLHFQEDGVKEPVYGRNSRIDGTVGISLKPQDVGKVTVKVEGFLRITSTDWVTESIVLLDKQSILWRKTDGSRMPSEMPFSFRLPSTYAVGHDGVSMKLPLPPTCTFQNSGVSSGFDASVKYQITVEVEMPKAVLNKRHSLNTSFRYFPRSRPPLPTILPPNTFLTTIKSSPEEWSQVHSVMKSRQSEIPSLDVHVAIPYGYIYPISVPLPFHVQLQGSQAALKSFTASPLKAQIHISLRRKVGVEVMGQESWKTDIIGEGEVSPVSLSVIHASTVDSTISMIAWEGVIKANREAVFGTFRAGKLYMKDFLVLSFTPDDPVRSAHSIHQHFIPICLVSDHFDDMGVREQANT